MLSNEANLLWLSSVSLLHTNSSQVEALRVIFFLRKNIKEYFKIVVCTFFFLSPSVFPFFFQRNGDSQGQRLCLGTGHLSPTFASVAQACWHPCSEQDFSHSDFSQCLWRPGESSLVAVWLPRSSEVGGLEESGCYEHAEMQTWLLDGHQRPDISQLEAGARHNCSKMQVQAKPRGGVTVVHLVPLWCSAVEETSTSQNWKICNFDLASLSAKQSRFSCWRLEAAVKTHRASAQDLSGLSSSFHAEAEWKSLHGFGYRLL